jgi:hypothetical protein
MVVAANSNRLPTPVSQSTRDMIPPAPAISATAIPQPRERAAIVRRPGTQVSCSIAQQPKAKARTADVVWMKSGQVNKGPYGTGHPGVHVTCDEVRKSPLAIPSDTDGLHQRSARCVTRMLRAANAIRPPPAETSTTAARNQPAVGMPGAPMTLT